jgi:hypothetical protein
MFGAVVLLAGCSSYNPPSSQNQTSQTQSKPADIVSKSNNENSEDIAAANKRFECTQEVQRSYKEKWNVKCHELKKDDDCTMPPLNYLPLEKDKADRMDECFKDNPSKAKFNDEDDFVKSLERDKCLNYSEQYYIEKWDSQCRRLGRATNCTLPVGLSNPLDSMRQGQRDECYMKYLAK